MIVRCSNCDGFGHVFSKHTGTYRICNLCRGEGGFKIPDDKKLCPICNGRGTVRFIIMRETICDRTCDKCSGTGFVDQ